MPRSWSSGAIALMLVFECHNYAQASHCRRNQFYRVALQQCVGRFSALALPFSRKARPPHSHRYEHLTRPHVDRAEVARDPLTYVHVVEPDPEIPYEIPSSRMNHLPMVYFRIPKAPNANR